MKYAPRSSDTLISLGRLLRPLLRFLLLLFARVDIFFDKTYGFYRINDASDVYFSCAVLVFTKHTCFIVWRAHFSNGPEKCSKHMCFIGQDAKMLIFLLRGTIFHEPS